MAKKSTCPVSRSEFRENAEPVKVTIGTNEYEAEVKEFSTGSLGWYINGKATIEIGGKRVPVQVGVNLTVIGSKDLPREEEPRQGVVGPEENPAEDEGSR